MSVQIARLRRARDALPKHPVVEDARLVDRHDRGKSLEVVLARRVDRVPPGVLRTLARCDCGIESVRTQGKYLVVVAR